MASNMTFLGFPTGSLKNSSQVDALHFYKAEGFSVPEIHLSSTDDPLLPLGRQLFSDASVHLPSYLHTVEEEALAIGQAALAHGYTRLIIHPYVIKNPALWRKLGSALVVENMDFRFLGYRTAEDMALVFERLPEASFCLDVGHTESWNPGEAMRLLDSFSDRLVAVHYSEIDRTNGDHLSTVSDEIMKSHAVYLRRLPRPVPVIFEISANSAPYLLDLRERFFQTLA